MEVMKKLVGESIKKLKYFQFDTFNLLGGKYLISRTGYTGELGYELYISADKGVELWNKLLGDSLVKPAGLGGRYMKILTTQYIIRQKIKKVSKKFLVVS